MLEKQKIPRWILDIAIILIIASYAFIFNSVLARVQENKNNVHHLQSKIEELNPIFLQIQTDLSQIKTDIQWIKKNKE